MTISLYAKEVGCTAPVIYRLLKEGILTATPVLMKGRYIKDIDPQKHPPMQYRGYYKRGRPKKEKAAISA